MSKVSCYIIAFNEEHKIADAVRSVLWADEVILVDSHSSDGTARIAEELGARVLQVDFDGFGDLRNRAVNACSHQWIFSLDADERATPEVCDEVRKIIADPASCDAYRTPRRNWFMGRWIRHSGWYPNYRQPQLFRKGKLRYRQDAVHEGFDLVDGASLGYMQKPVWQVPFRNLEELLRKTNRYSTLSLYRLQHKKPDMLTALAHANWAFIKHYFFKLGMLDGWAGFLIAFGYFEQTFYRYAKRYEQWRDWRPPKVPDAIGRESQQTAAQRPTPDS